MSVTYNTDCLYTYVKNISGERRTFSFLPPHGVTLDNDEEYGFLGEPSLAVSRGDYRRGAKYLAAFKASVARGDLAVVSTPSPVIVDATTDASKVVRVNNGVLGVVDPCFNNSV